MASYFHHIGNIIDRDLALRDDQQHDPCAFLPQPLSSQLVDMSLRGGILTLRFRSHTAAVAAQQQQADLLAISKKKFGDREVLSLHIIHDA